MAYSLFILFVLFGFSHRFGRNGERMRAGQFAGLETMLTYPRDGLDQRMAEVLVHARAMEFQSLDLKVSVSVSQAKQAFEARL
jgi:hypothetical protein